MIIKQQLNPILAEAYYEGALKEINMLHLTTVLEEVRSTIFKGSDPFSILKLLDIKIGSSQDKFIVKELVKIRQKYEELFIKSEIKALYQAFKKSKKKGFKSWYALYIKSVLAWRSFIAEKLAEEPFPFPAHEKHLVEKIQRYTRYIRLERWVDCYPLFVALKNYRNNTKKNKSRLLIVLVEIELYLNYNMSRAKKYLAEAKQVSPDDSWNDLGFGIYALQNSDIETAKKLFARFAKNEPQREEGYYLQGDCYLQLEKYDIAEQWYIQGINQTGDNYNKYLQLFKIPDFFQKNQDKFSEVLEMALITTEDRYAYAILLTISSVYVANKQYKKGIVFCQKALNMEPDRLDAYIFLADTYLNPDLKLFRKARQSYNQVIRKEPESFDGYWGMAGVCESEKKWKDALNWYRKSMPYRKIWEQVIRIQIADMHQKLSEFDLAEQELLIALRIDPEESRVINSIKDLAYELYTNHNEIEKAISLYKKVGRIQGKEYESDMYNQIGNVFFYHHQNSKAKKAYQKACEINDQEAVYFANLGGAFRELNQYDDAINNYKRATVLSPDNDTYYNQIGKILYSLDKTEESISWYEKAINLRPEDAIYYGNLALALHDLMRWSEAEENYRKAVGLEPDNDIIWNNLGLLFYDQHKDVEAVKYYQKAIDVRPGNAVYHANLGLSLEYLDRWEESVGEYLKATELDKGNANYWNSLGNAASKLNKSDMAESAFLKATEVEPDNDVIWNNLGILFYEQKKDAEAIGYYQKAIEIRPDVGVYYANLGLSLGFLDRWEETVNAYKKATELDKNNAMYLERLGIASGKCANWQLAESAYKNALELEPENANLWNDLGLLYYDQNNYEQAVPNFQKAIEINPEIAVYYANLGLSLGYLDRWDEAVDSYRRATDLDKDNPLYKEIMESVSRKKIWSGAGL